MAKKIKVTKAQRNKLSKSWLGIILIVAIIGYNFYQEHKTVAPGERFVVTLSKCVDGDTAWFKIAGKDTKVRFLYIDTPESTNQIEPFGQVASDYTKEQLSNATTIELELNKEGDQTDKYDRLLAWVFVDGELLQEKIAHEGLVKKYYDYGYDYTYKSAIIAADQDAKAKRKGIYSNE